MEKLISSLFAGYWGKVPDRIELLPASGSARKYYRIWLGAQTYIGAYHKDRVENRLFLDFSAHFRAKGLHVPEVYLVSTDGLVYIQEDLGDTMLLNVVQREKTGDYLNSSVMQLYRKALAELVRFQVLGHNGLDYSNCLPRPVFDKRCIQWDLNYFKYCFLRLTGADFSEEALEDDFERLTACLCTAGTDFFMFRDFQSRNIMVKEGEVWFIDYQGGRRGALQYDVASLLYDAIVAIPEEQRDELLEDYIGYLQAYVSLDSGVFRKMYYPFVLVRLLQAMGAFGLRGLYEKKPHFIASIQPGLKTISSLWENGKLEDDYPEIRRVVERLL